MLRKHRKFKEYWEEIGKPELEVWMHVYNEWDKCIANPSFIQANYRIKGDPHWELRRKWIDSDRKLQIEFYDPDNNKWYSAHGRPLWLSNVKYREAKQQEKEDYLKIAGNSPIANWLWDENQKNLNAKLKILYSTNDEDYNFSDLQDVIDDLFFFNGSGIYPVYECKAAKPRSSNFFHLERLLNDMLERACEESEENSDGWLDNLMEKDKTQLSDAIKNTIDSEMDKLNCQPDFYMASRDSKIIYVRIINEDCWGVIE